MKLVGANPDPRVMATEPAATRVNYFISSELGARRTDVPTYTKVHCQRVTRVPISSTTASSVSSRGDSIRQGRCISLNSSVTIRRSPCEHG